MTAATLIRRARTAAGLTQAELAARAGTSQATVSLYERARKDPSAATLDRLLRAAGWRLEAAPMPQPTPAQLAERATRLEQVLELAEALPVRHPQRPYGPVAGGRPPAPGAAAAPLQRRAPTTQAASAATKAAIPATRRTSAIGSSAPGRSQTS